VNARLWRKAVADQTKVRTGPCGQRQRPGNFSLEKRLLQLGGAGGEAKLERLQGEARQCRAALARRVSSHVIRPEYVHQHAIAEKWNVDFG